MNSSFRVSLLLCCALAMIACRDRPMADNAEVFLLQHAVASSTPEMTLTVSGRVQCNTCSTQESTMLVELWQRDTVLDEPLQRVMFNQLGPYQVVGNVPHGAELEVKVVVATAGVFITGATEFTAPDDTSLTAAPQQIDVFLGPRD